MSNLFLKVTRKFICCFLAFSKEREFFTLWLMYFSDFFAKALKRWQVYGVRAKKLKPNICMLCGVTQATKIPFTMYARRLVSWSTRVVYLLLFCKNRDNLAKKLLPILWAIWECTAATIFKFLAVLDPLCAAPPSYFLWHMNFKTVNLPRG